MLLYSSPAAPAYIHNCPDLICTCNGPGLQTQLPIIYVRETLSASALDLLKVDPQQLTAGGGECTSSIWPSAAPSTHPPRHPTPPHQPHPAQPPAPYPTAPHTTPSTAPSAAPKASFKIPAQKKFRGADNKNGTRVQWLRSPWEDGLGAHIPTKMAPAKNSKTPACYTYPLGCWRTPLGFFIHTMVFLPRGFTVHIHQHCSFSHLWASHAGEGHFAGLHNDIQAGQPHETRNSVLRSTQR